MHYSPSLLFSFKVVNWSEVLSITRQEPPHPYPNKPYSRLFLFGLWPLRSVEEFPASNIVQNTVELSSSGHPPEWKTCARLTIKVDDPFQLVPVAVIHRQFCIEAALDPGNGALNNGGVLKRPLILCQFDGSKRKSRNLFYWSVDSKSLPTGKFRIAEGHLLCLLKKQIIIMFTFIFLLTLLLLNYPYFELTWYWIRCNAQTHKLDYFAPFRYLSVIWSNFHKGCLLDRGLLLERSVSYKRLPRGDVH